MNRIFRIGAFIFFVGYAVREISFAYSVSTIASVLDIDVLGPSSMQTRFGDIALGQDKKSLSRLAKRLRSISALPEDAPANHVVHIGIIESLPGGGGAGPESAPPKIVVDFANAGDAAMVLFKSGAVILRSENASDAQRAKLGVEGGGPFDLENAPKGLLAGFRIDAFGARVAFPRDYFARSDPHGPFCASVREWAALYGVRLGAMRIYVFRAPTRINVLQNGLSGAPEPKSSLTWTAGIECRDHMQSNREL